MAHSARANLTLASEVLQHTQALIDGAIKAPSDLDSKLLREARKSQSAGPLADQYKTAVSSWEKSEKARLEALMVEQSSQEEVKAAEINLHFKTQAMEVHPDLEGERQAMKQAELNEQTLREEEKETIAQAAALFKRQEKLPWHKKIVSRSYVSALSKTGTPAAGMIGWLAGVFEVANLANAAVGAQKKAATYSPLIKEAKQQVVRTGIDLQNAKVNHPERLEALEAHGNLLAPYNQAQSARIAAASRSEQAYDVIGQTLKARWNHPDFQALARAVSQLSQGSRDKLKERIGKVYPQSAEVKEAWHSRSLGSNPVLHISAPLASTQSASSDPFLGTALWWMMINSNSTVFQSPLKTDSQDFLSDFSRHACIEPDHSHLDQHSHASDNVWSSYHGAPDSSPTHSPDYATPSHSPSYDHSPSPSYDSSPSPSPGYDSPPSYDSSSSSSFSSGGDY